MAEQDIYKETEEKWTEDWTLWFISAGVSTGAVSLKASSDHILSLTLYVIQSCELIVLLWSEHGIRKENVVVDAVKGIFQVEKH